MKFGLYFEVLRFLILEKNKRENISVFVSVHRCYYMYYNHSTWQGYSIVRFYDVASNVFLRNESLESLVNRQLLITLTQSSVMTYLRVFWFVKKLRIELENEKRTKVGRRS